MAYIYKACQNNSSASLGSGFPDHMTLFMQIENAGKSALDKHSCSNITEDHRLKERKELRVISKLPH